MSEPTRLATRAPARRTTGNPGAAVAVVFVVHGLLFASWTAHIPHVEGHLGLTDSTLGVALLGAPIGSVALSALTGWLLPRYGSRAVVRVGLVGYCAAGLAVGFATNLAELFAALFGWGAFQGMLDVSMNTQAIAVEQADGRRIMSGLHGGWGTGAFLGAALGSAGVALGLGLAVQLAVVGVVAFLVAAPGTRLMVHDLRVEHVEVPVRQRFSPLVLLLGATAFASMLCEGAAGDWAAVYLHDHLGVGGGVAGLSYTTFALALVVTRFSDLRLPTHRVIRWLALLGAVGFGAALAVDDTAATFVGFALLGVGLGTVVPTCFAAAGRLPGVHPGTGVATVAAIGWAGFMTGPPLIGWLAGATSLRAALLLLVVLTALIALVAAMSPTLRGEA